VHRTLHGRIITHVLWNCALDHVFGSNESMHKGSSLSRQYLTLEGIDEVLDLIRMTKLKGYKVCTTRAVILESFLLD
jgi:hypothetical protein